MKTETKPSCCAILNDGYACGNNASCSREGTVRRGGERVRIREPLCRTHARAFDNRHKIELRPPGTPNWATEWLEMDPPAEAAPRLRIEVFGPRSSPALVSVTWDQGARWESANPDRVAVRRQHLEQLRKHRAEMSGLLNDIDKVIPDLEAALAAEERR